MKHHTKSHTAFGSPGLSNSITEAPVCPYSIKRTNQKTHYYQRFAVRGK